MRKIKTKTTNPLPPFGAQLPEDDHTTLWFAHPNPQAVGSSSKKGIRFIA